MSKPQKKPSRWRRRALIALGTMAVGVPALWVAIHEIPGFGPACADGARWLLGPRAVAWAEDVSYGIQDQIDRWRYKDAAPKTFWEAPTAAPAPIAVNVAPQATATSTGPSAPQAPPADEGFPPPAFTAPHAGVASPGDGTWVPMKDGTPEGQQAVMWKAVVHPDPKRTQTAVAVVAMDLKRVDLHLVAGVSEPQSDKVPADHRPGLVPKGAEADLIAAFNGGFKAIHGRYGMMLDGETFVVPRDIACTVGLYKDGAIKIRTWPELKGSEATMVGYRQTPPCLVEEGKINNALEAVEYNKNWGATVSGETVIRRSAIGVDKTGRILFYALGEAVTAQALSHAMKYVGAENAAQLDVNYSYPRFLVYERASAAETPHVGAGLIPGLKFGKFDYVRESSPRDFFYVTRKRPQSS